MPVQSLPPQGIACFVPPYREFRALDPAVVRREWRPGESAVWLIGAAGDMPAELEWVQSRPHSMPLFVILPAAEEIAAVAPLLRHLGQVRPRAVIPTARGDIRPALRTLLASPPRDLPTAVAEHLHRSDLIPDPETGAVIRDIFTLAPQVVSIRALSARMFRSRRTLGRFFQEKELPVPSHWLQFARILHVAIEIQNTRLNAHRVSVRYGYTDGFTMSNSMKRLTGYRPSFVREHLGWEWLVDAWVRREEV